MAEGSPPQVAPKIKCSDWRDRATRHPPVLHCCPVTRSSPGLQERTSRGAPCRVDRRLRSNAERVHIRPRPLEMSGLVRRSRALPDVLGLSVVVVRRAVVSKAAADASRMRCMSLALSDLREGCVAPVATSGMKKTPEAGSKQRPVTSNWPTVPLNLPTYSSRAAVVTGAVRRAGGRTLLGYSVAAGHGDGHERCGGHRR